MKDIAFIVKTLHKHRMNNHMMQLKFAEVVNRVLIEAQNDPTSVTG